MNSILRCKGLDILPNHAAYVSRQNWLINVLGTFYMYTAHSMLFLFYLESIELKFL